MDLSLSSEQLNMREHVIRFAREELNHHLAENDAAGCFPRENWKKCCDFGVPALLCPKEYGGAETDLLTTLVTVQALAYACKDAGLVHAIVTQMCCMIQLILFGTDEQKHAYLPRMSDGTIIAAQAITEPDAGSDILAMRTKAERQDDGYVLNGAKIFISNGPQADVVTVFAVTDAQRKRLGGISCFLLDWGAQGFDRGKPLEKMGLRTLQNGELFFDGCFVGTNKLLGREGQGMIIFGEVIEWERALLSAAHLGTMERILESCIGYADTRSQFGQKICTFQAVSNKIATMKMNLELGKLMMVKVAWLKDQGKRATLETSIGKLFVSESLKSACLDAIQIHGAYGYMREYEMERELRDSIASTIYSGTSELQRNIIASLTSR